MVKREEALLPKHAGIGTAVANLDLEEERRDGKAEIAELINVFVAIIILFLSQRGTLNYYYERNEIMNNVWEYGVMVFCKCGK